MKYLKAILQTKQKCFFNYLHMDFQQSRQQEVEVKGLYAEVFLVHPLFVEPCAQEALG